MVSILNSDRWRQFAKYGSGSKILRSKAYRKLLMLKNYASTYHQCRKDPLAFHDVKTFCMFVGHVKSGGTMIGSLLDAHPNVILADEADVLSFMANGFSREQIYHVLLKSSRRAVLQGRVTARRLNAYSFLVPNQWQGRYSKLEVIGVSRAGPSTQKFGRDPALLHQLIELMGGLDVKLIHVIRNPYDPISLMMIRGKRTHANAIKHYFDYCETLESIRASMSDSTLLSVRYEDFVDQPELNLVRICQFLGIDATEEYKRACLSILYDSPDKSRQLVNWDQEWKSAVQHKIEQFGFLEGYSYEN